MNILISNDDGYMAKGIKVLANIMKPLGKVTVIAPKKPQSGMSMAISMGFRPIAYKSLGNIDGIEWSYLDATPASCIKFGLNRDNEELRPDLVVSGINHGSNASAAVCYSGTLGAAAEASLNGILGIGVSLCTFHQDADFSAVEKFLPEIISKLIANPPKEKGVYYNINFPDVSSEEIKGIKVGYQGRGHWIKEYSDYDPNIYAKYGLTPEKEDHNIEVVAEEGEKMYMMVGTFVDEEDNNENADHRIVEENYISIVAHKIDCTEYKELENLKQLF